MPQHSACRNPNCRSSGTWALRWTSSLTILRQTRQCTGASLANRYTKAHSDTYRFGAVVGYAALLCMNDVCGAHGAQIRRYGQAAGLPQDLWLPMARGSLDSVPGATAEQKTRWVLGKLIEHIRAGR